MKTTYGMLLVVTLVVLSGCVQNGSMNLQRASLHGAAEVSAVLYLDEQDPTTVETKQARLLAVINDVRRLVNQGDVAGLTFGVLREQLRKVVPFEYQLISDGALMALSGVTVPTDLIGTDNIKRVNEFLDGAELRVRAYDVNDRPKITRGVRCPRCGR